MFDLDDFEEIMDSFEVAMQNLRNVHDSEYSRVINQFEFEMEG